MKEELKAAYIEREKAELLLSNLDKKSADGSISSDQQESSKAEYSALLDKANKSIKSLKSKLRKEFNSKADELESLKREIELLRGRFEIREISAQSYRDQLKLLKKLAGQLEKQVKDLSQLINSECSADLRVSRSSKKRETIQSKDSKRKLSMGNILVIGLIAAITIFVIVFAFIHSSSSDSQTISDGNVEDESMIISSVDVSQVTTSAGVITWSTNKPARSQLEFGTTDALGSITLPSEELKLDHRIHLSGLDSGTTYYFKIRSIDVNGNEAISSIYEIVTDETYTDKSKLTISEISVFDVTDSSATIIWKTDKEASSQVEYGVTFGDGSLTQINEELSTAHEVLLSGLNKNTTYYFRVISKDSAGNQTISDNTTSFITLSSRPASVLTGKQAPDFVALNLEGEKVAMKEFRGKWVLLVFWQAKCGACRTEMPHLQSFYESNTNDELVLLAISVREKESFIRVYAESQGLTFPILMDPVGLVVGQYRVKSYPTSFLIDPEGIVNKELSQVFKSSEEIEETVGSIINDGG